MMGRWLKWSQKDASSLCIVLGKFPGSVEFCFLRRNFVCGTHERRAQSAQAMSLKCIKPSQNSDLSFVCDYDRKM